MKKLFLYILILLSIIILQSCARTEDGEPGSTSDDTKSLIIGVWESENYVVSFGNDGFYSAYIADEFIDSGDYAQSKNIVSCQNSYFNRTTIYTVEEVSDDLLKVNIDYKDLYGNKKTKSISFTKVKKTPSTKNNTLSGKSYTFNAPYFGNITMSFNTYNSGIKSATKGSAKQYPLNFFYIYIGEKVYYQILENATIQVPSIGAWTNYNDVICWTIDIGTNGEIIHIDTIPL